MTATSPTGEQYTISYADQRAVVTEVGAGLRHYSVAGADVVVGYAEHEECHSGRGQHLLPWPNRIRDGVYTAGGTRQQLALSEPERHNAIHGLTRWTPWRLVAHADDRVEQELRLFPQTGWSATLDLRIVHTLDEHGLGVEVTATNLGGTPAPFGYAAHPYLTVGEDTVDEVALTVPAARHLEVDDRLLPVRISPVDGLDEDCRTGAVLGARAFDTALTDLHRDDDGRWRVLLRHADRTTTLWGDEACTWVQVFTGDSLSGPLRRRSGIAVEPMTCGPDAFNDGPTADGTILLAPGGSTALRWGISSVS